MEQDRGASPRRPLFAPRVRRRVQQCSDALRLAGLLALKEPAATTALMHSQLARLNGQLAALQVSRSAPR